MTTGPSPYWDWNSERDIPAAFFDKEHLKETRAVTRDARPTDTVFSTEALERITSNSDFYLFCSSPAKEQKDRSASGFLEASPHNTIHVWLGGSEYPMATMQSPLDPIFWVHHANVDRLWLQWTRHCMDKGLGFVETLPANRVEDGVSDELTADYWHNYELKQFWIKGPSDGIKVKVSDTLDCIDGRFKFTYDTLRGNEPRPEVAIGLLAPQKSVAKKPLTMSVAKISNVKEGFIINEERGTLLMKFLLETSKLSATNLKLIREVVGNMIEGKANFSSAVLLLKGIRIADDKLARKMLLNFQASYASESKVTNLGTTGFFVHNHHGSSLVDLQIDIASLFKDLKSPEALENKVITITINAVQVKNPKVTVRMDKKMFEGTQASNVEAKLEFRQSRRT